MNGIFNYEPEHEDLHQGPHSSAHALEADTTIVHQQFRIMRNEMEFLLRVSMSMLEKVLRLQCEIPLGPRKSFQPFVIKRYVTIESAQSTKAITCRSSERVNRDGISIIEPKLNRALKLR